jgi:hypothetical protein
MRTPTYGRITPAKAERMAASLGDNYADRQQREALRLLTGPAAPVRASAPADDGGELDGEFRSLWPPRTRAEAERRAERAEIAASARRAVDDHDLYLAIFGEEPGQ